MDGVAEPADLVGDRPVVGLEAEPGQVGRDPKRFVRPQPCRHSRRSGVVAKLRRAGRTPRGRPGSPGPDASGGSGRSRHGAPTRPRSPPSRRRPRPASGTASSRGRPRPAAAVPGSTCIQKASPSSTPARWCSTCPCGDSRSALVDSFGASPSRCWVVRACSQVSRSGPATRTTPRCDWSTKPARSRARRRCSRSGSP